MVLSVQVQFNSAVLFPDREDSLPWLVTFGARTECKSIPFDGEHHMGAS